MKINALICLFVLLYGCRQHEPVPQLLTGDWRWTSTSGGFGGVSIKPAPTDRIILRFFDTDQFAVVQNDTIVSTGAFRITQEQSIYSGKEASKITITQSTKSSSPGKVRPLVINGIIESLSDTQLSIADNAYDGYGSSFTR